MELTYDPKKNAWNIVERGLSFERVADFDFLTAQTRVDDRNAYGEIRYVATGYVDSRLHVVCYTETPDGIRVISFRKANARERKTYEAAHG